MKKKIFTLISVFFMCGSALAAQNNKAMPEPGILANDGNFITVIAIGQGTERNKALEQAWIEAVRLAVGMILSSKSELNNDEFTEYTIAHSRGVIDSFDIVNEASDGKRVTVAIQARVHREILMDAAKIWSEAQTVKADTTGAIKVQMDLKAKDTTTEAKQKSGIELLKEVLDTYGPEMFYSATLDPKVGFDEKTKKPYLKIEEKFNEDLFWKEFLPKLRSALEGVAVRKEKKIYAKQIQDANQRLAKNKIAKGLGLYFGGVLAMEGQQYDYNDLPYSWSAGKEPTGSDSYYPTGGFLDLSREVPVAVILPDNGATYTVYYLDRTANRVWITSSTFQKYRTLITEDALLGIFVNFSEKMDSKIFYTIQYLDKQGDEIYTQAIDVGQKMIGNYRSFFLKPMGATLIYPELLNRIAKEKDDVYYPIMQAYSFAPGYLDQIVDLCLSSSQRYFIDLDESDLQKLDSIKFEYFFENQ